MGFHWTALVAALVALAGAPAATEGLAAGDPGRGAEIYERCLACHALDRNRTGPKHCGLLGRTAGTEPGFAFSEAMRSSRLVWTGASLDRFLADPLATVPNTTMGYDGIKDPGERADLIAYLARATLNSALCR